MWHSKLPERARRDEEPASRRGGQEGCSAPQAAPLLPVTVCRGEHSCPPAVLLCEAILQNTGSFLHQRSPQDCRYISSAPTLTKLSVPCVFTRLANDRRAKILKWGKGRAGQRHGSRRGYRVQSSLTFTSANSDEGTGTETGEKPLGGRGGAWGRQARTGVGRAGSLGGEGGG